MKSEVYYESAHLFVAAIRVLTHFKHGPPTIESVCEALSMSEEKGHHMSRKLVEAGIVEVVTGGFGTKLFVKNHLALEDIPRGDDNARFDEAVKKFKDGRKDLTKKVESFKAQQDEKKRKLFADLERQLKKSGIK